MKQFKIVKALVDILNQLKTGIKLTDVVQVQSPLKGFATAGDTEVLIDLTKNLETNALAGSFINISIGDKDYIRSIASNTEDSITFTAPLPGNWASAVVGEAGVGEVTITFNGVPETGNTYTAEVVQATDADVTLNAIFEDGVFTVTLGTDELGAPVGDTADEVVAAIIALGDDFTAEMTGTGGVMAETIEPVPFSGGVNHIFASDGDVYEIILRPL